MFWWTGEILIHLDITQTKNGLSSTAAFTKIPTTIQHKKREPPNPLLTAPHSFMQHNIHQRNLSIWRKHSKPTGIWEKKKIVHANPKIENFPVGSLISILLCCCGGNIVVTILLNKSGLVGGDRQMVIVDLVTQFLLTLMALASSILVTACCCLST